MTFHVYGGGHSQNRDSGVLVSGQEPSINLNETDRGEQSERASSCGQDQPAIGIGQRGQIAALDIGNDKDFGLGGVIERARHSEMRGRAGKGASSKPIVC